MAGLVFIAELRIPPDIPWAVEPGLDTVGHDSHYTVCLRTLQLLMIYWRGIGWILTTIQQKYRGIKETDPGVANIDPYSEVALSDRKMISHLLRHVEGGNGKNLGSTLDGLQDASKPLLVLYSILAGVFYLRSPTQL